MTVDCIYEIGGGDFGRRLLERIGAKKVPLSGSMEVTERCNLGCVHCYINQNAGDRRLKDRELTLAQICDILDQAAGEGCLFFLITGGEPFLRPDFLDIHAHAKKLGLMITLFTNATLITAEIADFLARWPPYKVDITLYGATAETYEAVSGVPGSFVRCLRGIELLRERGVGLTVKAVVTTVNQHELQAMHDLAQSVSGTFRWDPMLMPRLDGGRQPESYRLTSQEIVQLEAADAERWVALEDLYARFGARSKTSDRAFSCAAGHRSFHVDPYGQLRACSLVSFPTYDLTKGTFREGWQTIAESVSEVGRTATTECDECIIGTVCEQCPAWSHLVHGDLETPVGFVCETAHRRAELLGILPDPERTTKA